MLGSFVSFNPPLSFTSVATVAARGRVRRERHHDQTCHRDHGDHHGHERAHESNRPSRCPSLDVRDGEPTAAQGARCVPGA